MDMFEHKKYVYEVYKAKSFSKAAENMYLSQPSLSLTIKKVEKNIGAQLFDRSTTPIQMTECGMEYIRYIEKIMELEESFETYLSDMNTLRAGSIAIGAGSFFASYILPPVITKFKSKFPKVAVRMIEAGTSSLEKQLYAGQLDLIIDNYNFNEDIYRKHYFYSEHMILAVPEKLPHNQKAKKYRLSSADIIQGRHLEPNVPAVPLGLFEHAPFILLRQGNDTRERADSILKENQIKPRLILELDQLATAYHVACQGMGATLISDTMIRENIPDMRIVYYKIESPHARRENYFYYKRNKYVTRAMHEFLEVARQIEVVKKNAEADK